MTSASKQLQPNPPASAINRKIVGNGSFLLAYQLKGKHCLVIGGGREAANRTFFALDASAQVTVIAPGPRHPAVQHRIDSGLVAGVDREFMDSDLETTFAEFSGRGGYKLQYKGTHAVDMVLVCIDDHEESRRIATLARKSRIPVNCADIPELCDFYFMAQYRDQELQIAVSTNGGGPRLGARIRNDIVAHLNPSTPQAVSSVGNVRTAIRTIDKVKNNDDGSNLDTLKSRMGWISRFCDSWTFEELAALDSPDVIENVLDSFRKGSKTPSPPLLSVSSRSSSGRSLHEVPSQLTSFWWCPSAMGYTAWMQMGFSFLLAIGAQILYLLGLHFKLLVSTATNSLQGVSKSKRVVEVGGDLQRFYKLDELIDKAEDTVKMDSVKTCIVESASLATSSQRDDTANSLLLDMAKQSDGMLSLDKATQIKETGALISSGIQCKPDSKESNQQHAVAIDSSYTQCDIAPTVSTESQFEIITAATTHVSTQTQQPPELHNMPETASLGTQCNSLALSPTKSDRSLSALYSHYEGKDDQYEFAALDLEEKKNGSLYLVGAGPGHPELLTIQAAKILMRCDLVVSDRLIPKELLDLIDPEKLVLSSFKMGGNSDKSQDESNEICLKGVQEGKMVARFKTGDPFIYGRGGEEIIFFRKYGIEPIVAPGLSSVFGACSANSIPVTHRGVADQVLVLSGRGQGGTFPNIPEYDPMRTTIVLMSLSRLEVLSKQMIERGYPHDLTCLVIQKGTWMNGEKVSSSNLEGISAQVLVDGIENPAMLIVGRACNILSPCS